MLKYLYEELKVKHIDAIKLPIDLAYSIPFLAQVDKTIGSEVITFKPVVVSRN